VQQNTFLITILVAFGCGELHPAVGGDAPDGGAEAVGGADAAPVPDAGLSADAGGAGFTPGEIYPTKGGGRVWYLPDDADRASAEWQPETLDVIQVAPGVFRTQGDPSGQVRLDVPSPPGAAWWQDVEMTGYFRYTGLVSSSQQPHWELFARGERHSSSALTGDQINGGVAAPPGTVTWPGYPYGSGPVDPHCLGTAYHGNAYTSGRTLFEKEISHTAGYAAQRAVAFPAGFVPSVNSWFGLKFVLRNAEAGQRVHMELWIDADASGNWALATQTDDTPGGWAASSTTLDGCSMPPFGYGSSQILGWAGPWVTFRSDAMTIEFRALSVREIGPLP